MSQETAVRRPRWVTAALLVLSAALIVAFVLLGNWQIRRLAWKQDLIAAVDGRAFGDPVELPKSFTPDLHAYLRVVADGEVLNVAPILVKAVTEIGPGHWVMTPLQTETGIVWVNRGFVSPDQKDPVNWSDLATPVTGLLRQDAPGGTLIERNRPDADRWVSRDTQAMSRSRRLGETHPYFINADAQDDPNGWPRGGLTKITFRNSHLPYALTWYAMAALFSAALVYVIRTGRQRVN